MAGACVGLDFRRPAPAGGKCEQRGATKSRVLKPESLLTITAPERTRGRIRPVSRATMTVVSVQTSLSALLNDAATLEKVRAGAPRRVFSRTRD